jgi:hypothetical protein
MKLFTKVGGHGINKVDGLKKNILDNARLLNIRGGDGGGIVVKNKL